MVGVPMNGSTSLWRETVPFRKVLVEEVFSNEAVVRDLATGQNFTAQAITPSGRAPRPGDVWVLSNELGSWTFHKMVDAAALAQPIATTMAMMNELDERNEINWRPFDDTRTGSTEVPVGAYIGERRFFEIDPGENWLKMDGSDKSRLRYRALFELIGIAYGPGDGVTTFTLPNQNAAMLSTSTTLSSYDYYSVTGGSDPTVTTTATVIPGFTHNLSIPSAPTDYTLDVDATIALDMTYSGGGLPDAEAILRVDAVAYASGGFSHSIEFKPTANGFFIMRNSWKVSFAATGAHTVDITVAKADATGIITVVRKNSHLGCKLFKAGGGVTVTGSGAWYICAG